MTDLNDLKGTLAAAPDWERLNAYEMTKRCCAELTKRGQRVPSWMSIRDIIGKGSAGDINRGKDDFRREHGAELRKMGGIIQGVPETLSPHVLGFWKVAVASAQEEFAAQVVQWQNRIERAEAAVAHAQDEQHQAVRRAEVLQGQLEGLQEAINALQGRVDSECAARAQAERMFATSREGLIKQCDVLRGALTHAQEELNSALARLEGAERHALLEIDRSRTEAQKRIAHIEAKAKQESDEQVLEMAQMNRQLHDVREQLTRMAQHVALREQENESMRERLQRAEAQTDRLASENVRLATAMQEAISAQQMMPKRKVAFAKKHRKEQ